MYQVNKGSPVKSYALLNVEIVCGLSFNVDAHLLGAESGTGGLMGYIQARFSKRSAELLHKRHASARGQIGPVNPSVTRWRKLPQTLDFASTTWDQQNRLLKYELYRSLGLDPDKDGATTDPWNAPVQITLKAWSEAVHIVDDTTWQVLKEAECGDVITLDSSVTWEWAGDYEIMKRTIHAFQGDASQMSGTGGSSLRSSDANSGVIELVLLTYIPEVFFDDSDTPSFAVVPGY